MAASPLEPKSHGHNRSKSWPCRSHPVISLCNDHLCRLGASYGPSTSSSSMRHKLNGLQDLHDCIEKLLQLHLAQEILVQECQEKWIDELLDGSLRILDVCTAAKDTLLHTKECTRELQSIIRRKRGGELELATEVKRYVTSGKVVRKAISKALRNLKGVEHKCMFSSADRHHQTVALIGLLKDAEVVTLSLFESLLSSISGQMQSKPSSWSLGSKFMITKKVACTEADDNDFRKVDAALHKIGKSVNANDLQNQIEKLESCIQDIDEGLESLFSRLIKTRVSLLNILTH